MRRSLSVAGIALVTGATVLLLLGPAWREPGTSEPTSPSVVRSDRTPGEIPPEADVPLVDESDPLQDLGPEAGGWILMGDVAREDGTPIADAEVTLRLEGGAEVARTKTGVDGVFTLTGLELDTKVELDVVAADRAPLMLSGKVTSGSWTETHEGPRTIDLGRLVLGSPSALSVVLRGPSGDPVDGARVGVDPSLWFSSYPSGSGDWDERGRRTEASEEQPGLYVFSGLPPGGLRVEVDAEGHASFVTYAWLPCPGPLELELSEALSIGGRVVREDETPLPGARVLLYLREGKTPSSREVVTNTQGEFVATGLPEGLFHVSVQAEGHELSSFDGVPAGTLDLVLPVSAARPRTGLETNAQTTAPSQERNEASREPPRQGRLEVTIIDATNRPVPRAEVFTGYPAGKLTDRQGLLVLRLPTAVTSIRVEAEGFIRTSVPVTLAPDLTTKVTVTLERGAEIKGRLLSGGAPHPGGRVSVCREEDLGHPIASRESGAEGRFVFRGIPTGTYAIIGRLPRVTPRMKRGVAVEAGGSVDVGDLRLEDPPDGKIEGRVVDEEGRPVAGAWISMDIHRFGERTPAASISDPDGRFSLEGLPEGEYPVAVRRPGYFTPSRTLLAPATGLELVLKRVRSLRGRVVDAATGRPVPEAAVYGISERGGLCAWRRGWLERAVTDLAGGFRFGNFRHRANVRCLAVEASGYATAVVLVEDRDASEDVIVPLGAGIEFQVAVVDVEGAPVPDAMVCLARPDGCWPAMIKTDTDGHAGCPLVPAGAYQVYLHHESHGVEVVPLDVRAGLAPVTLTLRGSATFTVRVQDQGGSAQEAEIEVLDADRRDALGLMSILEEGGFIKEFVPDDGRTYRCLPRGRYHLRARECTKDAPFGPEASVDLGENPVTITLQLP